MPQFSLTQLLMTVALAATLLTLARSEGCGARESMIVHLEFSSDGKQLLVARFDDHDAGVPGKHYSDEVCRTICVVDSKAAAVTQVVERVVKPHRGPAFGLLFGLRSAAFVEENAAVLVQEFGGGELRLYDLGTGKWRTSFAAGKQQFLSFDVSRNQKVLATLQSDDAVALWDVASGSQLRRIVTGYGTYSGRLIGLSADGELVATCGTAGVQLWKMSDGTCLPATNSSMPSWTGAFGFSPAGHTLALWQRDRITLCDVDQGLSRDLALDCKAIAFSSDGSKLAAAKDDEVMLVDGSTGQSLGTLRSDYVTSLAISPDGEQIAVGDYSGYLKLWTPGSGNEPKQIAIPGRTDAYTWPLPFAALVIWAIACWCIWAKRNRTKRRQTTPNDIASGGP
jgi:WD40 repeat protein